MLMMMKKFLSDSSAYNTSAYDTKCQAQVPHGEIKYPDDLQTEGLDSFLPPLRTDDGHGCFQIHQIVHYMLNEK